MQKYICVVFFLPPPVALETRFQGYLSWPRHLSHLAELKSHGEKYRGGGWGVGGCKGSHVMALHARACQQHSECVFRRRCPAGERLNGCNRTAVRPLYQPDGDKWFTVAPDILSAELPWAVWLQERKHFDVRTWELNWSRILSLHTHITDTSVYYQVHKTITGEIEIKVGLETYFELASSHLILLPLQHHFRAIM